MKISLKWINDLIDIQEYLNKPQALADQLTKAGLEVEAIEDRRSTFQNVIVGHILEKSKHPNADKLSVCRVALGKGEVSQIVCGAKNHNVDDRVIVALPGAHLPGDLKIQKATLRGVESSGMLCSLRELGMVAEGEGIAILPKDAPVGTPYAQYAGVDDVILELKVTPNRADCLSHYGIARELSALISRPFKTRPPAVLKLTKQTIPFSVEVKNSDHCPRYAGRIVQGVKVGPSPTWLRQRLEILGLNSINNVVDITNYVMMEMGQPLHAFDLAKLRGHKIVIDSAKSGQNFTTLKKETKVLSGFELMIADGEGPIAMAGVIGGLDSGVSEATTDIFIESANFNQAVVRKASRFHQIETDSAYRFSRGVSQQIPAIALERAAELILEVAGGAAEEKVYDEFPGRKEDQWIEIRTETISRRLGYQASGEKFRQYMLALGFAIKELGAEHFSVSKPAFRFDIEHEMDLIEEYARLEGYENIPETFVPLTTLPSQHDPSYTFDRRISRSLQEQGLHRAFNLALINPKDEAKFLGQRANAVRLRNPLSEESSEMRGSLAFSLFQNAVQNFRRGNEHGGLFEIDAISSRHQAEVREEQKLAIVMWGHSPNLWQSKSAIQKVYALKSLWLNFLRKLGLEEARLIVQTADGIPAYFHPSQTAELQLNGKTIGHFGTLHPSLAEDHKLRTDLALLEVTLAPVMQAALSFRRVETLGQTPIVERDLAFVMKKTQAVGPVVDLLKALSHQWLKEITVFDVFAGGSLAPDEKSVAFKMWLQNSEKSLEDKEINELLAEMIQQAKDKFAISMR